MPHHRWPLVAPSIRLLLVAMLVLATGLSGRGAVAQDAAPEFPVNVIDANGVQVNLLALAPTTIDPANGNHLTLERITIQQDAAHELQSANAPALIVAESGSVLVQDERGFFSRTAAPFHTLLEPGSAVTWTASEPTTLLRLGMTATPPASTADAGIETQVLASLAIQDIPAGDAQLFIARATLSPGMASVRIDYAGTTGLLAEAGVIEVLSPSGLEGRVETGATVLFPPATPMNLLGTAATDATALFFGITTSADPATVFQMTVEDAMRNIRSAPPTEEGSTLALGETWVGDTALMTIQARPATAEESSLGSRDMALDITYTNLSDESRGIAVNLDDIVVQSANGGTWPEHRDTRATSMRIEPGESETLTFLYQGTGRTGQNITVTVEDLGGIQDAQWQGSVELGGS